MTGTNLCVWRRTIRRIVKDRDLTEEVLQESWRRMLASRVDLPTPHDWENYFKRVLINTARDHWRARVRASEKSTALDAAHHLPDQREDQLLRVLNAERQAHEGQILREVRAIIDRLPATQRQAILLLIGKDRSETLEAISRREGIAISTLRSRMYSGIRRIRRLLQQKGLLLKDEG